MKTIAVSLFYFLLPLVAASQINSSLDFVGEIGFSYRHLNNTSTDLTTLNIFEKREREEAPKINWRVGFNYNRHLTKRVYLKTGVRLASTGFNGEKKTGLVWPSEHDGMGGFVLNPNLPHEQQVNQDFWFVEFPIAGRIELSDKRFTPFIELGISPSIYLTTRSKFISDIDTSVDFNKEANFNSLQFIGNISFGLNYTLKDKVQLFGQPIFQYHFTKSQNAPIEEFLFSYGLEVGIRRKIN